MKRKPKQAVRKGTGKKTRSPSLSRTKRTAKKKRDFLKAFSLTDNISEACKAAEIGRQTVYDWQGSDPKFKLAFDDIREADLDFTEGKLRSLIKKENLGAICFYLKCQGRHRGWLETMRQEVAGEDGGPIMVVVKKYSEGGEKT